MRRKSRGAGGNRTARTANVSAAPRAFGRRFVPRPTRPFARRDRVGIVLGAGATKACDGPLTAEILPQAFEATRGERLELLNRFLQQIFAVPASMKARRQGDYPPLPTLLSLIDTAIDREHDLGVRWPTARLRQTRRQAEYAVFRAIYHAMRHPQSWNNRCHEDLLHHVHARTRQWPTVVSLNYDLRIDYAMIETDGGGMPDYGCDIRTDEYRSAEKFGRLFKIHGSMHWTYCPSCHRLEVGMSPRDYLLKTGLRLSRELAAEDARKNRSVPGLNCRDCDTWCRPVMITPTSLKDYRNPHIASLWYQAERALQQCTRMIFVGYSLPWDDVDVIYLFKRGLSHLKAADITVVEWAKKPVAVDQHEAGQRYQAVFGRGIDWQPLGFVNWVKTLH